MLRSSTNTVNRKKPDSRDWRSLRQTEVVVQIRISTSIRTSRCLVLLSTTLHRTPIYHKSSREIPTRCNVRCEVDQDSQINNLAITENNKLTVLYKVGERKSSRCCLHGRRESFVQVSSIIWFVNLVITTQVECICRS